MLLVGNSYLQGVFNGILEDSFKISGHLKIQHSAYLIKERMLSLSDSIKNVKPIISLVESFNGAQIATARIKFGSIISLNNNNNNNENNEFGMGIAIDPFKERELLKLHQKIADGSYFNDISEDSKEAIIGAKLAERLELKLNDEITLITRTAYGSLGAINLKVIGISSFDNPRLDQIYYIPLAAAQRLLDLSDGATEIVVKLESKGEGRRVKGEIQKLMNSSQIKGSYIVTTWEEATGLKEFLPIFRVVLGFLVTLLIFSTAFGIINTMSMAVFERTKEIGVMQAFGFKPRQILLIFLLEALVIGAIGGIIGLGIGSIFGYLLEVKGISLGEAAGKFPLPVKSKIYADLTFVILIRAYIIGITTSILATFLPAFKAARLKPTEALRSV
jgi:putative ABC transport system permease protein